MTYNLPPLGYEYDALEPFIDARTMEIHYSKHHKAYTDKLNAALDIHPKLQNGNAENLISNPNALPNENKQAIINNGGGYVNHTFFWQILKVGTVFKGEVAEAIKKSFGGFEEFKKKFSEAATTLFGSGWAWLVLNEKKELEIIQTKNQDSPLALNKKPLLCIDVWEHAYYLKYQNKRPDYVEAFFNVINWDKVNENFVKARRW